MSRAAVSEYRFRLGGLKSEGHAVRERLQRDNSQAAAFGMRTWQFACATMINELSGGSKAHWLSRAYNQALLVRATDGEAVVDADVAEIVRRVLDVLEQARRSLADLNTAAPVEAAAPHRFDFVHDPQLRPVLEQAFAEAGRAFDAGDYEGSLKTASGILEAIISDALKVRLKPDAPYDVAGLLAMSFNERIAAAESAGVIRGGCARLPAAARAYRDADETAAVSERDAAVTRQVLRVVMRDLDPGR
jgi:hypothetical protein